jgi:hypothetical protein
LPGRFIRVEGASVVAAARRLVDGAPEVAKPARAERRGHVRVRDALDAEHHERARRGQ